MEETGFASSIERHLSHSLYKMLTPLPVNATISESVIFRDVLSSLEYFIPKVLQEVYNEWKYEGLDGVLPATALKTNDYEVEIVGLAIILSDQTLTPVYVRLQIIPNQEEIAGFECKLGELGPDGMVRLPYGCSSKQMDPIVLVDRLNQIEWAYEVSFRTY